MEKPQPQKPTMPEFIDALLKAFEAVSQLQLGRKMPFIIMVLEEDQDWIGSNACPYRVAAVLKDAHKDVEVNAALASETPKCIDCPYDDIAAATGCSQYLH
jgi:N-dimethylarginine dimethylaminohydrolase